MNDLDRMEKHYKQRKKDLWSPFNCYPFLLSCKQTYMMTKILQNIDLEKKKILDIGAGEGNFILKLLFLGAKPNNVTAIEFLKERYLSLMQKLPQIKSINDDYLNVVNTEKYDIITLMAVLTSITDNNIRYTIFEKALAELNKGGMLILYDYFREDEKFLSEDYRALSESKIRNLSVGCKVKMYKKVYIKSKYAYVLCKLKIPLLIPFLELFKIFNDDYHFVVIKK